jgi:hypothetical protein
VRATAYHAEVFLQRRRRLRLSNVRVRDGLVDTGGLHVLYVAGFVRDTQTSAVATTSTTLRCDLPCHSPKTNPLLQFILINPKPMSPPLPSHHGPAEESAGWRSGGWQRRHGGERRDCDERTG